MLQVGRRDSTHLTFGCSICPVGEEAEEEEEEEEERGRRERGRGKDCKDLGCKPLMYYLKDLC